MIFKQSLIQHTPTNSPDIRYFTSWLERQFFNPWPGIDVSELKSGGPILGNVEFPDVPFALNQVNCSLSHAPEFTSD